MKQTIKSSHDFNGLIIGLFQILYCTQLLLTLENEEVEYIFFSYKKKNAFTWNKTSPAFSKLLAVLYKRCVKSLVSI